MAPTGDLARNPDVCPDWELNQQPFASQVGTQSTEPHQPGPNAFLKVYFGNTYFLKSSPEDIFSLLFRERKVGGGEKSMRETSI